MQKTRRIVSVILAATLVLVWVASCSLDSVSREERLSRFQSDLNNNRSKVRDNLHPDLGSAYNPDTFWNNEFDIGQIYTFTITAKSGSNLTTTVSASGGGSKHGHSLRFEMKEDGKDVWFIRRIYSITEAEYIVQ